MKKTAKKVKKLVLAKETVRKLEEGDLRQAFGGALFTCPGDIKCRNCTVGC